MVAIVTGNGLGLEKSSANTLGSRGQLGAAFVGRGNEAVTVNAATGNLVVGQQDELLIGRGPDSAINRTYNSRGLYDDDNGDNWRLGIQRRLKTWSATTNVAGATVTRTGADGTDVVYGYDPARGLYVTSDGGGAYDTLQFVGHWIWKDGDSQVTEAYDNGGNLISRTDRDGNSVGYQYTTYNGGYRLSRVFTADGNYTDLAWNGNNLQGLSTHYIDRQTGTSKTLSRTRYSYTSNRLTKVTVDLSPDDNSIADGRVYETTYGYDGAGRMTSIAQTDGTLLTFGYDGSNRIATFAQTVETGVTRTTSFAYGSGYTNVTDPQGNVTRLYYEGGGLLTRMEEPTPLPGGNSIISSYYYYSDGSLYWIKKYDGSAQYSAGNPIAQEYYRYDNNGNLFDVYTWVPNQGYEVARHYYDTANNLLSTTTYTGVDGDGHGGVDPTGGMTTRYVYDSENHLRFAITPEGRVSEYRYDGFGNRIAEITHTYRSAGTSGLSETFNWSEQDFISWTASIADKSTTTRVDTTYDFRGNVSMVTAYARVDVAGNGVLDAGASRTLYIYDQFGSLLSKRTLTGTPSASLGTFGAGNLSIASAGTIAGKPATQYTVLTGGAAAVLSAAGGTAAEGDAFSTSFTLKGVGSNSAVSIGLYGVSSGWGSNDISIARIVSGSGQIIQELGGLWNVTGLSNSTETRIEITRLYRSAEGVGIYLYPDRPNGFRAGAGVIFSDPVVYKAPTAVETYAYDGMGRTIRFTDAKGVGTWTTYADSQNRTIVTHANGLVQTSAYNRTGELVASSESRGGYASDNMPNWSVGGLSSSPAGMIDGVPATKYTVPSGSTWSGISQGFTATAGETFTVSMSLLAVAASNTTQYFGLHGNTTGWGTGTVSSVRIIAGPGTASVSSWNGGLWQISGLSTTEATRVEVTRTYTQAESGAAYLYVDLNNSFRAGQELIASAPVLISSRYGILTNSTNAALFDITNWGSSNLAPVAAGTVGGGAPAQQFTVQSGGAWSAAYGYLTVKAGDTATTSIILKGTATGSSTSFGLFGEVSGWGYGSNAVSTARILSGPGTLAQAAGGLWNITGLVAGVETRVEVTRTYDRDQTGGVYLYPDMPGGWITGHAIIAGAPSLTVTPGDLTQLKYDAGGNLRIKVDAAGNRTFYFYDALHRKIGEVAADGAVTEFRYDASDRLVATVAYASAYSAGQIASLYDVYGNPTAVTFATIKSQIGTTASDRWQWNIYDHADRLIETIDARGYATAHYYDNAGRLLKTTRYNEPVNQGNTSLLETFKASPPASFIQPGANTGADRSTRNFYSDDGLLVGTLDEELYLTEFVHDKAGRQVESIRYFNPASASYGPQGTFQAAPTGTFANAKGSVVPHAKDIRNYTIYDGRDLVAAQIDGEGNVTRFGYDARGEVIQELRGQKVSAATAYTLASLPAASGQLQVTNYVRDALGQVVSQSEQLASGNLTSAMAYSWTGDVTTATDARGNATNRYYDALGRLVRLDVPIGTDGTYASTIFEYDARGNLVKTIDARGNASYNYYDERSRLVLAIDAEGYATRTTYTVFGQIATVLRYSDRATGIGSTTTQPTIPNGAGALTSFVYDIRGQATTVTDAEDGVENNYYNAFGEKYYVTNKLGGGTSYVYTRRGQLYYSNNNKQVFRNDGSLQASNNYDVLYHYDAFGNVGLMVRANNTSERRDTTYAYDRANRLIRKNLPAALVYNPANGVETPTTPQETYAYDARGNVIETVDATGGRTLSYYDEADRKIAEISPVGTHRTFFYDGNGNLTAERTYDTPTGLPSAAGGTPPSPAGTPREVYYAYDKNDRLIETRLPGVATGQLVGGVYQRSSSDIVATIGYDATGNVIRETDARGNSVYHYYDKAGRELGKIDQEKYLTVWTRDSEGNVLEEKRFANLPGTGLNENSSLSGIIYWTVPSSADRITQFTYDRMGRRLTEKRLAVAASTVSGNSVSTSSQNATIAYTYNALGEVLSKTEATGDRTDYQYDPYGRMTTRLDQGFYDWNGDLVGLITRLYYDGNDNLVYERPSEYHTDAGARATRYVYGSGGRLTQIIDTTGFARNYAYDAAGRVLREYYTRTRSDGVVLIEDTRRTYDLAGRLIGEVAGSYDTSTGWTYSPQTTTTYTAFGEVATRSVGGVVTEQYGYDKAGRVVKSNAGDGVWKFFLHDANGNVTLTLTSTAATHLGSWTQADALASAVGGASVGLSGFTQTHLTASVIAYDRRGMATETFEPNRQIADSANVANTTTATLNTRRWYNAFGEAVQERSARGYLTNYAYNTMGRLVQVQSPEVTVTFETGGTARQRPTENYAYDVSGRLVATQNANGFWTTRVLLLGTGYGDDEALVRLEYRPDSSVWQTGYDVFGNARYLIDGGGRTTWQDFDYAGRLTAVTHANGLKDDYVYDAVGNRIRHWNSFFGLNVVERTDYDRLGRVVNAVTFAGDTTVTNYTWNASAPTNNLNIGGSWTKVTSTIADRYSTIDVIVAAAETKDTFGRVLSQTNVSGQVTIYTYDAAGLLIEQLSSTGRKIINTYYNTGQLATSIATTGNSQSGSTEWDRLTTTATYNADDQRVSERLVAEQYRQTIIYVPDYANFPGPWEVYTAVRQDGRTAYDEMGRLATWHDLDSSGVNKNALVTWSYDAAGNIRHMRADYKPINAAGILGTNDVTQEYWYRYDALNRMVTSKGVLSGGSIVRGSNGIDLTYNGAGRRATAANGLVNSLETYVYNSADNITDVQISVGGGASNVRATTSYDLLGRVIGYAEYSQYGALSHQRYDIIYDLRGQVTAEKARTLQGPDWIYMHTANYYTATGETVSGGLPTSSGVAGTSSGSLLSRSDTKNWKNGATAPVYGSSADSALADRTQVSTYVWSDAAEQKDVTLTNKDGTTFSQYYRDASGALYAVSVVNGVRPHRVSYITDAAGRVLERTDTGVNYAGGGPRERYYRFDGIDMGTIGSDGTDNVDYNTAIAARNVVQGTGAYRNGATTGSAYADFDQSFDAISPSNQGGGGAYIVGLGDTLPGLAQTLWGDASLWYLIAEANGLSGSDASLSAGQMLIIPEGINLHNDASTFRPYDPANALGDVQPGTPIPKGKKCGGLGMILLAVVAVAVTLIALPAGAPSVLQGVLAGAAGSAASQAVGLATGLQDKFSFKGLALSAIAGGVMAGLGNIPGVGTAVKGIGKSFGALAGKMAAAVAGNAITQGIGVATGLQDRFSWAGVAAAGVGAGVGPWVGGGPVISNAAGGIAASAAQSLVTGKDFGDTLVANLPGIIGNTVGNIVADQVAGLGKPSANPESKRFAGKSVEQIADLRIQDAAKASGNTGAFLSEVGSNADLRSVFVKEARIIAAARDGGYSLDDAAAMIGADLRPGSSSAVPASADETVVTGNRTFGDAVANTLVVAQDTFNSYTEGTRDMIGLGLAVLRGGPVGAIGGYAINEAVSGTLSATGLDQQASKLVALVGSTGLSILSSSPLDYEVGIAEANGRESGLLVEAGSTILGIGALGKLQGTVRGEGGRFGDLKARGAPNDDLTPHHIPQAGRGFTSYTDGGAIMMTTGEHALTRTFKARGARTLRDEADLPFRDTLARDIRDVRSIGGSSYNKGLQDVLDYYRKNHPELMKKGQ